MLLTPLLTLLLVSTQCVSDIQNGTFLRYRCEFSSKCCTRDFVNIQIAPTPKLTSQASVPDHCFPVTVLVRHNSTAQRSSPKKVSPAVLPRNKSECAEKLPLNATNATVEPHFDEVFPKSSSRDEFRKLRRFHFGREVPVLGICLCVILDCALIALVCVALHIDDDDVNEEDADEFLSMEDVHEATTLREAETQTSLHKQPVVGGINKSVQTMWIPADEKSPEEIQAIKFDQHRQSEC
ncbi:hypothetical protein COOONC_21922 [Cooperia oncophora]